MVISEINLNIPINSKGSGTLVGDNSDNNNFFLSVSKRLENFLRNNSNKSEYGIIVKNELVDNHSIHLSNLLPNSIEKKVSREREYKEGADIVNYGNIALVSGGELIIDENIPKTLPEILTIACNKSPKKKLIFFKEDGSEYIQDYQEILEHAERILSGLRKEGLEPGDRVIFQFSDNFSFIVSFWACILGGFIPAPLGVADDYSEWNKDVKKLFNVWELLGNPYILVNKSIEPLINEVNSLWRTSKLKVLTVDLLLNNSRDTNWFISKEEDIILNLFTSGSTGSPKCVQHNNKSIIHMLVSSSKSLRLYSTDTWLNWMPLDHVGGLIMSHLQCTYVACNQVHPPIGYFLENPLIILDWIDMYKVTFAWAPNFAFSLVNGQKELLKNGNWNLTSVRCFINGADVIIAQTTKKFLEILKPFGLSEYTMTPAFGMSELSSAMIYGRQSSNAKEPLRVHSVSQQSLNGTLEHVSPTDETAVTFTEIGSPIHNVSIRIVDKNSKLLHENQIGRFQVKCPQMMVGYYNNSKANDEVFVGDGWFDTGDLGFINNGKLTITGRSKDMLIINGKNYYNYEFENVVEELRSIEVTYTAACGVYNHQLQKDELAIFFVPVDNDFDFIMDEIQKIKEYVLKETGVYPKYVIPLNKEEFYKTGSGKIERNKFLEAFNQGLYNNILKEISCYLKDESTTLPNEIYKPSWVNSTIKTKLHRHDNSTYTLVFADKLGLYKNIPGEIILVSYGDIFEKLNDNHFIIDPSNFKHYLYLFQEVKNSELNISHIIHIWNYNTPIIEISTGDMKSYQQYSSHSILYITKAIHKFNMDNISFLVVTNNALLTSEKDCLSSEKTTMVGMVKTITHEFPKINAKLIDFDCIDLDNHGRLLKNEYFANSNERLIAYRNGERKVQKITRINPLEEITQDIPLKQQGFYVFSGFGGIAEIFAEELLTNYQAKIVILGRKELYNNSISLERYKKLSKDAENYKGKISFEVVDIADYVAVNKIISMYELEWGVHLNGIFNFAGVIQEVELKDLNVEILEDHYQAKVYATMAMQEIVETRKDCILVNSSSSRSIHSGMTMAAYSSANEFVEMYTQYLSYQKGIKAYCFSWSIWDEIGMSENLVIKDVLKERGFSIISPQQGKNYMKIGLRTPYPLLYIGLNQEKSDIRSITTNKIPIKPVYHIFYACEGDFVRPSKLRNVVEEFLREIGVNNDYQIRLHLELVLPKKQGNIDFQKLNQKIDNNSTTISNSSPETQIEREISLIWKELIPISHLGTKDNFFALGGNSLNATQLISRLKKYFNIELKISDIFVNPTLESQGKLIEKILNVSQNASIVANQHVGNEFPMSYSQQRQWFLYQWEPDNPYYLNTISLKLLGVLDVEALKNSFQKIIDRHHTLQSNFNLNSKNEPIQLIRSQTKIELPLIDLSSMDLGIETAINDYINQEATKPIDITKESIIRASIIKVSDEEHILLITIHHIVSDGWSVGILLKELSVIYEGILNLNDVVLPPLPINYLDYSAWQNEWIKGNEFLEQLEYWKNKLLDMPKNLEFPIDKERPAIQSYRGKQVNWTINKQLTSKLYEFTKQENVTLFMTLIGALSTMFYRYTDQKDFAIGSIVANRNRLETEDLIGFFANTLALRFDFNNVENFMEHLQNVRNTTLEAYENQDVPFELLIDQLKIERDPSRSPLFQTLFILQNEPISISRLGEAEAVLKIEDNHAAQFDLTFHIFEENDTLQFTLDYNIDLFNKSTIYRLLENYQQVLEEVVTNKLSSIDELLITSGPEQITIANFSKKTKLELDASLTIHKLFEKMVQLTPNQIACNEYGREITYQELNRKSNQMARRILKHGINSNSLVAILTRRSIDMLIGILGSLKAGCAFLPISSSLPVERINYLLEDSQSPVLLTDSLESVPSEYKGHVEYLYDDSIYSGEDTNLELPGSLEDLLYVIYTSGTTGKPKGVEIQHKTLVNLIHSQTELTSLHFKRVLQFAEHSFDVSFQEIFSTLVNGGKLFIISEEDKRDVKLLSAFLRENDIKTAFLPTSYFKTISSLDEDFKEISNQLEHIVTAGEQLIINEYCFDVLRKSELQLHNHYGPSETHVVTTFTINPDKADAVPPIGKPILNTEIRILNSKGLDQPIGVVGEIYIGGINLARGYLNKIDLTNKHFIIDHRSNKRLYKTGDMGRWLPDGNVEYIGRSDDQVKIRGYRIEIGEIESTILSLDFVKEVFVIATDSSKQLCAYVVLEQNYSAAHVKKKLKIKLPDYMIPMYIIPLERFILNTNGKIDRKSLPEPVHQHNPDGEFIPAESGVEKRLVKVWEDLLGVSHIGKKDNFFELGGHSLKATILVNYIKSEFQVNLSVKSIFAKPTIEEMAEEITILDNTDYSPIPKTADNQYYQLSSAQKRLYAIQQQRGAEISYNMPSVMEIHGEFNLTKLEKVLGEIIDRHHILKTTFEFIDGELVQHVHKKMIPKITIYEATDKDSIEAIIDSFIRPFDLGSLPLIRVGIITISTKKTLLMIDRHHIIFDGVSMNIFIKELMALYQGETLPELPTQYKDFIVWQNQSGKNNWKTHEKYWLSMFAGGIPVLQLPTDYNRPLIKSFEGKRISFEIDRELTSKLNKLSSKLEVTLYMVLVSAFNILLSKYSQQEDVVVGVPTTLRPHKDVENLIGMFVNTLPLKTHVQRESTFDTLLKSVKENILNAFEHQEYPFEILLDELEVKRDLSRDPLFNVMVVLQNMGVEKQENSQITLLPYAHEHKVSKFDLTLDAVERDGRLFFELEYATKLFKSETIKRMGAHFIELLKNIVKEPNLPIYQYDMVTEKEKTQLLQEFNSVTNVHTNNSTIMDIFDEKVLKHPERVALEYGDRTISYKEIDEKAERFASLLHEHGIGSNEVIGILTHRSIETIIFILGTLKVGAVFLPIDPNFPKERVDFMLSNSNASLLVINSDTDHVEQYALNTLRVCEQDLSGIGKSKRREINVNGENLAYIIYTSGSTGRPKGVKVRHSNVVNTLSYLEKSYPLGINDSFLFKTNFIFDVSITEIFGWFFGEGKLVILEDGKEKDPVQMIYAINKYKISHVNFVPSILSQFPFESEKMKEMECLKYVFLAGESLPTSLVKRFKQYVPTVKLENLYGPTEAAIYATKYSVTDPNLPMKIGKPIENTQAFILSNEGVLQPIGIVGELYLGGAGVTAGYINNPELTNEKFILNPAISDSYIYKTGDLAKWDSDGNIEFLGRTDYQVKIRGYRIELEEIQKQLIQVNDVIDGIVALKEDKLCAYYIAKKEMNQEELRFALSLHLPAYMIPSHFIQLEEFPLLQTGKVDRKLLPEPKVNILVNDYIEPRNDLERLLCEVWEDVLGIESVGVRDDFLTLGGDSIKSIQVVSRFNVLSINWTISVSDILEYRTIEKICLQAKEKEKTQLYDQGLLKGEKDLTPIEHWFFEQELANPHHFNQSIRLSLNEKPNIELLRKSFETLVHHHDGLRLNANLNERKMYFNEKHLTQPFDLLYFDLSNDSSSEKVAAVESEIKQSFDVQNDLLLKAVLLRFSDDKYELLLTAHHIIIDGVTWRIILDDFVKIYTSFKLEKLAQLPSKSASLFDWYQYLLQQHREGKFNEERIYWEKIENYPFTLPLDNQPEDWSVSHQTVVKRVLSEEKTRLLKTSVHHAFNTEINDILLTALSQTIKKLMGLDEIVVSLENHGRHAGQLDLTHTAGWFTSLYPILLALPDADMSGQIKNIKEQLRKVPNNGIGHGVLRYFDDQVLRTPYKQSEIRFNYLGQFNHELDNELFTFSTMSSIGEICPTNDMSTKLDMNSFIVNEKLYLEISYNALAFLESSMEVFATTYMQCLEKLIEFTCNFDGKDFTASDFSYADISQDILEDLLD